ncbi:very-long-chain (3R)-3-hydroxyacyl-CoA dehydratase 4 isoform X1 [Trichechus manatus latirostris]|uniref:Very-long-chain (3R)-3-hydroxyacyl-CoA dehydratase n=1 Tax=Trichechus manatus latirostris TaxID=127582 RepID=A0A2Y9QLT3_TRIMA|nr:very-long-chain (3R)-3-hydroxyacyl-CoA dehydratase 4 isoform X1 [Trichechus manatus latirostris]
MCLTKETFYLPSKHNSRQGQDTDLNHIMHSKVRYRKNACLFVYYLIQFCGHSWIFTNMTARFFSFGKDSVVDTFYAIGLVMQFCQSMSLLELLHIYVGIESDRLLPRFLQLTERIIILFVVITSQEEVQEKYVVWVLFIFWNLLDMVRYTYSMLSVIGISYANLTWLSQTLWMPIYPLCVLAEAFAIYQSLPYFESSGTYSTKLPFDLSIYFPYVLKIYLMMLFIGMEFPDCRRSVGGEGCKTYPAVVQYNMFYR